MNELVQEAVQEINESNLYNCKQRVKDLVNLILKKEESIKFSTNEILKLKEELRKLQTPKQREVVL